MLTENDCIRCKSPRDRFQKDYSYLCDPKAKLPISYIYEKLKRRNAYGIQRH